MLYMVWNKDFSAAQAAGKFDQTQFPTGSVMLVMYNVAHTAKSNGDGSFTSKNRYDTLMPKATVGQMDAYYTNVPAPADGSPKFFRDCYTPK